MAQLQDKQALDIKRLEKYRKYQASIELSGLEQFASNLMIRQKLMDAGFSNVVVFGSGLFRTATGIWSRESTDVKGMPSQIIEVKEL